MTRQSGPARHIAPPGAATHSTPASVVHVAALALNAPWAALLLVSAEGARMGAVYGRLLQGEALARALAGLPAFGAGQLEFGEPDVGADGANGPFQVACALAGIRSFAGAAIAFGNGPPSGMLCVFDRVPRTFRRPERDVLRSLGKLVAENLALRTEIAGHGEVGEKLGELLDAAPVAVATADLEGSLVTWSPGAERLYGWAAADVLGTFLPFFPQRRENADYCELIGAMRRGEPKILESTPILRADGSLVEARIIAAPLVGADGSATGFVCTVQDAGELQRAANRIRLLETAVLGSSDAVIITKASPAASPTILYINEAFTRMFGYAAGEVVGRSVEMLQASDVDADAFGGVVEATRNCRPLMLEALRTRKNGERFWCQTTVLPLVEADGSCLTTILTSRDVSERRRVEHWQRQRAEILEMIASDTGIEAIFAAILATQELARADACAGINLRRGVVLRRVAVGTALAGLFEGHDLPIVVGDASDPCGLAAGSGEQVAFAGPAGAPPGAYRTFARAHGIVAAWSTPIRLSGGDVAGTFFVYALTGVPSAADLHIAEEFARLAAIAIERRDAREQLEFLAWHDALTTLPNRILFEERLSDAIAAAEKNGTMVAVGTLDLDRFKIFNDSLGHAFGDLLLREVAGRLARTERQQDTIARVGGDEFVLLMTGIRSREEAAQIAQRTLTAFEPSFHCGGQEVFVRASMGIACYPSDSRDMAELLIVSDEALYEAKGQGGGVAFREHRGHDDGIARIALETSLNRALEKGEFEVMYQPAVDLRTREIRGAEALLRWNHPTLGRVQPDAFIRAAEETGLIVKIGAWVLEESCRFGLHWQNQGHERYVAVNVSARQFDRPEFVTIVTQVLAATGLEPSRLHLELTESLVMRAPEAAVSTLAELKRLGVKIVIDDFGTGYSSFNYLKLFPLDALKIDRLFVRDIGFGTRAPNDEAIVRAIVGVARALDLKIVAEGVENEDQIAFLRAIGVPLAQGFIFARALPPVDALNWTWRA